MSDKKKNKFEVLKFKSNYNCKNVANFFQTKEARFVF